MSLLGQYRHKKSNTIYEVEFNNTVSVKLDEYWIHNCVIYYQKIQPDTKYVRTIEQFLESFEKV